MQITLNLDYLVRPNDVKVFPTVSDITDYLIRVAVANRYEKKKMSREEQRIWAKAHDAVLLSINTGKDTADLTEEQLKFVYEAVNGWENVPTPFTSWYITLLDHLQSKIGGK